MSASINTKDGQMITFARHQPECCIMDITPALARQMLDTSCGNRRLRGWWVDLLAAAMKRGEWRVTSQGIGFDVDGHLRDAHHRLHACIQAGVSFPSVVVLGMRKDAYQVTDIGIKRSYSDLLGQPRDVADVLRLGCQYVYGTTKPTVDQIRPVSDAGLCDAVKALTEYCGSKPKYFASAPMKLAACVTIMNGGDADFVLQQYRALCSLDFDSMSKSAQALIRQVNSNKANANNTRETVARGLRIFDKDRQTVTRIQVSEADINAAIEFVRTVLRNSVFEDRRKTNVMPLAA